MPTVLERMQATALLPYVMMKVYINREEGVGDAFVLSCLRFCCLQKPGYDWVPKLVEAGVSHFEYAKDWAAAGECLQAFTASEEAYFSLQDGDIEAVALVLDAFVEDLQQQSEDTDTWNGVVGQHTVVWSAEEGGHVVVVERKDEVESVFRL